MINGYIEIDGQQCCANCSTALISASQNYCANCGNALTEFAIAMDDEKAKSIRLDMIADLSSNITDLNSLAILKEYLQRL